LNWTTLAHFVFLLPDTEFGLIEEHFDPFASEVVEGRFSQQLFGVEADKVFGLAEGIRNQWLQDRVDDVQHLKKGKTRKKNLILELYKNHQDFEFLCTAVTNLHGIILM
jgi:hypothetical protein